MPVALRRLFRAPVLVRHALLLLAASATLAPASAMVGSLGPVRDPGASLPGAPITVAQGQQPSVRNNVEASGPAAARTGSFVLSSADGSRQCAIALKADKAPHGSRLDFDRPSCVAAIAFLAEVTAWRLDSAGELLFVNADGRAVAEFSEGAAGSYEALREGDGVYFLSDAAADPTEDVTADDVRGEWDVAGPTGKPLCRWTLSPEMEKGGGEGGPIALSAGCGPQVTRLGPTGWTLEKGRLLVAVRSGPAIRFVRKDDGSWTGAPERGGPLLLTRP